ncbi:MAG: P22 coat - protein 5 family protein, partial [Chloroflexi bacterium]|nr:P22 coat - protein 5 family protein [Chloroflexota bacterium]
VGYMNHRAGKIAQAIRTLTNEVEVDLAALQSTCSRAYGTAGTTPFGTANDYTDASNVLKILKDNGAAPTDNQLVINTSAGANFLGKQSAVNAAGTDSMLRQGVLLDLAGMPIRESAQIVTGTAGTASSATTDTAGYAVGAVTITLASAGTGAILAGDFISFAGDSEKYMVTTGDADVSGGGTVVLAAPGLRTVIAGSATAITVVATSARNMAFNRSAIVLAARAPARPEEGDLAIDSTIITDPRSGLSLEFSMYAGYRKMRYEVALAWGVKNIKPEHTAILLG